MEEFSEEPGCSGGDGKYIDISEAKLNLMAVLMAVTAANPLAMGVDGALATAASKTVTGKTSLAGLMSSKEENADAPPAYLNYLFFDAEMNYKYGGFPESLRSRDKLSRCQMPPKKTARTIPTKNYPMR